jgi:two-component system, NarL family, response regulator
MIQRESAECDNENELDDPGPPVLEERGRWPGTKSSARARRKVDSMSVGLDSTQGHEPPRSTADPLVMRILVADDHPILLEGLVALINRQAGMKVVAEAADGREAVALFTRFSPDVAVLDLRMPGLNGIETVAAIRAIDPNARLIILTSFANDEDIYQALQAGARGYLIKDASGRELVECLQAVHEGRSFIPPAIASKLADRVGIAELTAREREVLALVAKGKGNREIGTTLEVTEGTIKVHVNNILNKLHVASRTEAVNLGVRRGLVRIDE